MPIAELGGSNAKVEDTICVIFKHFHEYVVGYFH